MQIEKTCEVLRSGGVALLPTDTVYGLVCRPESTAAITKIFALKARPAVKNLPVLVANTAQLTHLGVMLDARIETLLNGDHIPGALTLVLPLDPKKAPQWLAGRHEVAVRLPDSAFLRAVLRITGPLLATSANASGQEPPATVDEILPQLTGAPDYTVDDGPRRGAASTLINCQTTPFSVVRRGALSDKAFAELLSI